MESLNDTPPAEKGAFIPDNGVDMPAFEGGPGQRRDSVSATAAEDEHDTGGK